MTNATILLLPGLGNSGPDHWQTHWEWHYGYQRVEQRDWDTPHVEDWVECLHARVTANDSPKILVAHSLGCALVAQWSAAHRGPVVGALLVAPSDVEAPSYPAGPVGFAPMPLQPLGFRSMVIASEDDPYVPLQRGKHFAQAWGAEYVLLGPRGHIGSAAKLGLWQEGHGLLQRLAGATA